MEPDHEVLLAIFEKLLHMLAGLITYSRKELPTAVDRFYTAFKLDPSACDAV